MQLPKVPHGSLERKENMAAWSLPRPGRVSDPTLFQMTLVATLLATVLGDCGPPPDLLFASPINKLHKMDFKTGTVLKYTCHPGYSRIGSSRVTCNAKGLWDYSVFCIKKRCRNPGDLPNGKVEVKTDFLFGSVIEFSCSEGYILIGPTTSHCEIQDKGVDWSDDFPQCVIAKCEPPPAIRNGRHSGGDEDFYPYGSSVTYSCDPDFSLLGQASISCTVENKTLGVWSPSPPTCENIVCHQPLVPNGIFVSGFGPLYSYRDSIVFNCKKGYLMNGSSLIRCEADNKWHPSPPICELNSCIDLPKIPYASWERRACNLRNQEVFEIGTVLKYQCKLGYRPTVDEPLTVTCQKNLTWTTSKGCERVCCPTPKLENIRITRGRRHFSDRCVYAYEDHVSYVCDDGYYPVSPDGKSSCRADGKWRPEMPACEPAMCLKPEIKNGKLSVDKDQYVTPENVIIHCDSGYDLVGSQNITCSKNRTWYPEVPKCCDFPPIIAHGRHKRINTYSLFKTEVVYECDRGYTLAGPARLSCSSSHWSPEAPRCKAVCVKPEIANGRLTVIKNQYSEPDTVTVQCNSGYGLVGSPNITCSENRTWYPEVPRCEWVYPEGCEQVLVGRALMQCLPNPKDVKLALEVYKLSLEVELLERQRDKAKRSTP